MSNDTTDRPQADATPELNPNQTIETAGRQVLNFTLGENKYCVSINCVSEIVESSDIRTMPGSPAHVKGITDLRGQTTTVVDPATVMDISSDQLHTDGGYATSRIIVLAVLNGRRKPY
ncbi:MAG: chemotaxis protein CheW [Haloarculaceae archaeon]